MADPGHARDVPDPGVMYVHLARREKRDARTEFGAYTRYEANTPAFFPKYYGVKAHA